MKELLQLLQSSRDDLTIDFSFVIPWDAEEGSGGVDSNSSLSSTDGEGLDFHPSARDNFNAKAYQLLQEITSLSLLDESISPSDSSLNDDVIVRRVPSQAQRYPIETYRDVAGTVVARSFVHGECISGLQDEAYRSLRRLAELMQRAPALRNTISISTVEKLLFEWVREQVIGSTTLPATDYVINGATREIASYLVIFPIFKVQIPEPLRIGRITIRTITANAFDQWETMAIGDNPSLEHTQKVRALFGKERGKLQGFAGAEITLVGESSRVLEIARHEAEQAVALLRIFSPSMLSPLGRSYCALYGQHNSEYTSPILINEETGGFSIGKALDTKTPVHWEIQAGYLRAMHLHAWDRLVENLFNESTSDFAAEVRAALYLYSQNALKSSPAEKLLTIMIPLESLLLKSGSEPIAENISFRMAFAIGNTLEERKHIVEITRSAYNLRSAYVHHLKPVERFEDLNTLRVFMEYAWVFFLTLGKSVSEYRDKVTFLTKLDDRKLS
jgi:hypothetical protein